MKLLDERYMPESARRLLEEFKNMDPMTGLPRLPPAEHNRRAKAIVAAERWEERQKDLLAQRRQQAIDSVWEASLEAKREEAAAANDPEARLREMVWGRRR